MVLTVGELKRELHDFPNDWEVMISVRGQEAFATGVNMDVGGTSAWVTIGDYPHSDEDRKRNG